MLTDIPRIILSPFMKQILIAISYSTIATTAAIAILVLTPDILQGNMLGIRIGFAIVMAYGMSTFIGLLFVGLPTHFILKRLSISSIIPYIFVGFVIPLLVIFIFKPFGFDPMPDLILQGTISGVLGVICASVFWYFASKPNQSLNQFGAKESPPG